MEEEAKLGKWEIALETALQIYEGKIKLLANIPENIQQRKLVMRIFCQKLSNSYFKHSLTIQDVNFENLIQLITEFCTRTSNFEYLFTNIKDIIKE